MANPFSNETIVDENSETDITVDVLVGEGRKYKTPDELAKAYANADAELERRRARIAELEAADRVQKDLLEARLNGNQAKPNEGGNEDRQKQLDPPPRQEEQKQVDISELIRNELASANEESRRSKNIDDAARAMTQRFGTEAKAQEAIKRRAAELGVSMDWMLESAGRSPAAFFATMGVNPTDRSQSTPGFSTANPSGGGVSGRQDFKYYEELRKKSPKAFYSPEVQKQMFNSRRELGDKFYTT